MLAIWGGEESESNCISYEIQTAGLNVYLDNYVC